MLVDEFMYYYLNLVNYRNTKKKKSINFIKDVRREPRKIINSEWISKQKSASNRDLL
jgi:preprotein translocase subunit SecE